MLKYSVTNDDDTFSPTHAHLPTAEPLMKETIDISANPRSRAKMIMKKRAKQKRGSDFHMFPPISNPSTTPHSIHRKEVPTPYINGNDLDSAYMNALGISRVTDVTTPYVMHSHVAKLDTASPIPHGENIMEMKKELTRVSQMSHHNVVEVSKIKNSNHEHKVSGISPYIERRAKIEYHHRNERKRMERQNTTYDNDRNAKLQIQSNQMGLVHRSERHRMRENQKKKPEEPFSIRKKIEQFRKWHEEHYKDKLKKLKEEVDIQFEAEHRKLQNSRLGESPGETDKSAEKHNGKHQEKKQRKEREVTQPAPGSEHTPLTNGAENPTEDHTVSEHTWHTWRDVNDSYAYNDVSKYIEDNELMNKEKEEWIRKWISDVETALQTENSEDSWT